MLRRTMKPTFFRSAAEARRWLETNHENATELVFGFHKKDSGKGGITYSEALDEALCFGWIDGVRRGLDPTSYTVRFTPRKPRSIWSQVNLKRAEALVAARRMAPAGLAAFERRDATLMNRYSFEREARDFSAEQLRLFRANAKAWAWFAAQGPGYQKTCRFWVLSAKKAETSHRRLAQLIAASARGQKPSPFQVRRAAR